MKAASRELWSYGSCTKEKGDFNASSVVKPRPRVWWASSRSELLVDKLLTSDWYIGEMK